MNLETIEKRHQGHHFVVEEMAEYLPGHRWYWTCDTCPGADDCEWAFDPYNIQGDCLWEK